MNDVLFFGGDKRTIFASEYLKSKGIDSVCLNYLTSNNKDLYKGVVNNFKNVVLPMPLTKDGVNIYGSVSENGEIKLSDFYSEISDSAKLLTSSPSESKIFESASEVIYTKNEIFLYENAYITAEGAVGHILLNTEGALRDSSVLILGWGRIAKYLYNIISFFTDDLHVILRNKEKIYELRENNVNASSFDDLEKHIADADIIINTVPSRILKNNIIDKIPGDSCIYELASSPGGYDNDYVLRSGIKSYILGGLPGKCAPKSAGIAMGKCILKYIDNGELLK